MNTYLVTGGAGFIGSNLVEELIKENKVIVIDNFSKAYDRDKKKSNLKDLLSNDNLIIENVDITDYIKLKETISKYDIEIVIHLAGKGGVRKSLENPLDYQNSNLIGLQNILECMKENNIKNIIFASSSSVYGNNKKIPFSEEDICDNQISVYAQTKRSGELLLNVYHNLYNFNVIANRFFTVYGKRQRDDLAINMFTKKILNNEQIVLFGDGSTFRDYTYIDDIVDGIKKEIEYLNKNTNVCEIFNLGSHSPIKLNEMVRVIEDVLGIKANIKYDNMQAGDVFGTYADISKAQKLLGFSPKTNFKDGIKKYVKWYLGENNL